MQELTKVGDTITAKVNPENASSVSYQWYTGDTASLTTAIPDATTAAISVTKDQLGKFIGVVVTDETNGKTFTAVSAVAVQDEVVEELKVTEVKQVSATEVAITYNKAPGTLTYEVKQGSSKVSQSVEKTEDNTVTLLFASKLTAGDYSFTATAADGKKVEGTFTAEAAKLADVKFRNTNLVVSANTNDGMKTAYAMIDSLDQWGNHINLTSPSINISKGTASFKSENGLITATAPADAQNPYYVLNEKVVITVMYDNNQKVLTDTFTVVTASSLTELKFGDIQTDVAAYKDKKLTQSNVRKNIYFVPVTSATDSEGLPVTTDTLNKMLEQKTQTLFISPNTNAGMVYADEFVEKKINGVATPCLVIKGGTQLPNLSMDLTSTISVLSQGGAQTTISVPVVRDPVIDTLTITAPELYSGKEVKLSVSAVDQYGDKYDLYTNPLAATKSALGTASTSYDFNDKTTAGSTATTTTFTITMPSAASDFRVVKNTADKTLDFYVTPVNTGSGTANEAEGYVNISGTTANFKPIAVMNLKVNKRRTPDSISELKDYKSKISATSGYTLDVVSKTKLAWSDGVAMDDADKATETKYYAYPLVEGTYAATAKDWEYTTTDGMTKESGGAAQISDYDDANEIWNGVNTTTDKYVWTATLSHDNAAGNNAYVGNAITLTNAGTQGSILSQTSAITTNAGADTGASDTMTIHLYKLSQDTSGYKIAEVSKKEFTFTITSEADTKFEISVPDTLYVGKVGTDTTELKIEGEDGTAVSAGKLNADNVQIVDQSDSDVEFAFNATTKMISCKKVADKDKLKNGEGTALVTASIENTATHQTQEVKATLKYSTEAPYVNEIGLYKEAAFDNIVNDQNVNTATTSFGFLKIRDQYDTDYVLDGGDLKVVVQNHQTTGTGRVNDAVYSTSDNKIYLYGTTLTAKATFDTILSYKGKSKGTETFTIGVTTPGAGLTLGAKPAVVNTALGTFATITSGSTTFGTADAPTVKLFDTANAGIAAGTYNYGIVSAIGANSGIDVANGTTAAAGKISITAGTGALTIDAAVPADTYTIVCKAEGYTGTASLTYTVNKFALSATAAGDVKATFTTVTTANTITAGDVITFADGGATTDTFVPAKDIDSVEVKVGKTVIPGSFNAAAGTWTVGAGLATPVSFAVTPITVKLVSKNNYSGTLISSDIAAVTAGTTTATWASTPTALAIGTLAVASTATSASAGTIDVTGITLKDQYGTTLTGNSTFTTVGATGYGAGNTTLKGSVTTCPMTAATTAGAVTLTFTPSAPVAGTVGDEVTCTMLNQKFTLTEASVPGAAASNTDFTISSVEQ